MPRRGPTYTPVEVPSADLCADGVLTVEEVAAFAKVSEAQVWVLLKAGALPSLKPGKRRVVPKRALVAWLEKQLRVK